MNRKFQVIKATIESEIEKQGSNPSNDNSESEKKECPAFDEISKRLKCSLYESEEELQTLNIEE